MPYALGAVKPNVKSAADYFGNKYQISVIYGVGSRETVNSDHPKGLALDFMVGDDLGKGDALAADLQANASKFGVTYLIWKQHIWNIGRASEGWRLMEDRGGVTANHFDHVHASFAAKGSVGGASILPTINIPNPIEGAQKQLEALINIGKWLADTHNWLRVGYFIAGFILILLGVILLAGKEVI